MQQQQNKQKDGTSNTNKEYCNQLYVIFIFCSVNNLTYLSKYHTQEIRMILQSLKGQQERCALHVYVCYTQSIMGFYPAIITTDLAQNRGKDSQKLVFLPISKPCQINSIFIINRPILYIYPAISTFAVQICYTNKFLLYSY